MLNRLLWSWRGLSPLEIGEVLARIAASRAERTSEAWLDTVIGYRGGNWIYEWSKQAAFWQQKAQEAGDTPEAGQHWLHAVNLYSPPPGRTLKATSWRSRRRSRQPRL